jgi:peptidoglycan L-alanyl-D-glutamate endopeptidase CwlK
MTFKFSAKSLERLSGVHPDLQRVFQEAITNSPYDFSITEGIRTLDRQKELFEAGKSQTMRSRHLTGHAVDIAVFVDGKVTWDFPKYQAVADHIKSVAKRNDVSITWGGDWVSFKDGPHYELNKSVYPDAKG